MNILSFEAGERESTTRCPRFIAGLNTNERYFNHYDEFEKFGTTVDGHFLARFSAH
jgi:hypothetical protein